MKRITILFLLPIFFVAGKNNELTRGTVMSELGKYLSENIESFPRISGLGIMYNGETYSRIDNSVKVLIDIRYDNCGWPPEKYRQLEEDEKLKKLLKEFSVTFDPLHWLGD